MTDRLNAPSALTADHPSLAAWEDELFTHGAVETPSLRAHLDTCEPCAQAVAQLTAWMRTVQPHDDAQSERHNTRRDTQRDPLRERIIASRRSGARTLVPMTMPDAVGEIDAHAAVLTIHRQTLPWYRTVITKPATRAAAIAAVTLGAVSLWRQPTVAEAGMVAGRLDLLPARPKLGDTIQVTYTSAGLLGKPSALRLRARIRTSTGDSYNNGVPVITVATLERRGADQYVGRFVLPDSVVFAALAVEDSAASAIDDFAGRAWELLRHGADDRPLLDALEQQGHDLMGRSWEEGLITAREMVRYYPDSVRSWNQLQFMESNMGLGTDSARSVHRAKAASFAARMNAGTLPMQPGLLFWYTRAVRDSALAATWRDRLLREAPRDEFAVQERAGIIFTAQWKSKDSVAALAAMEQLWKDTPLRRQGQIAQTAHAFIGVTDRDAAAMRRWTTRMRAVDSSIYRRQWIASEYAKIPSLRDSASVHLAALAAELAAPPERGRQLNETQAQFARRMTGERALTEAMLGHVLAQSGRGGEALTRLRALPDVGWNVEVFDASAAAATSAGDTALAIPHWARLALDPRTNASRVATLDSLGTRFASGAAWRALKERTRGEMASAVMRDARRRRVEGGSVRTADGRSVTVASLAKDRPAVVVFWSPMCGPAVEALPSIQRMAKRLETRGVPVVLIVEQERADSTLTAVLAASKYRGPVYFDATRDASRVFSNWGTPQLYVLDRDGRVVFDPTSSVGETTLRLEALLASSGTVSAR